jgi:hypothetical protein
MLLRTKKLVLMFFSQNSVLLLSSLLHEMMPKFGEKNCFKQIQPDRTNVNLISCGCTFK